MDNLEYLTVVCQGGLDTSENHLTLDVNSPGAASELVNYEVGLYGGYKRLDGFEPLDDTYDIVDTVNGEGGILGIFIFNNTVIAARKQSASSTYKFYYYTDGVGWTAYAPGFSPVTTNANGDVYKIRAQKVVFGATSYMVFVDGVNPATVYDGTTWYQLLSTNAGGSGSPGGNQIIDAPSYVTLFKNTVFLSGDVNYPGLVVNSAPEDIFTWTAAAGGGQIVSGFTVSQIKPFRDTLYVFGQENVRKIVLDGTDFVIQDVAQNIGCIASDSVIEINGDILFLAQDGIRTISGTDKIGDVNIASISKQVQRLVNELQESYDLRYLNSVVIKKKSQFRYFVSNGLIADEGVGIIGGLRLNGDSTSMEYSELRGIRTAVTWVGYLNNDETVLHGDYDGSVYKQESGNSFNGSSVVSIFSTPFLTFGSPILRKQLRKLQIFTKYAGFFEISTSLSFDWLDSRQLAPNPFSGSVTTEGVLYDSTSALYDDPTSVYPPDVEYPVIDLNIEGSCKSVRYTFNTSSTSYPHTIQGYITSFTPQGKR